MNDISTERTPYLIAAEINSIKDQTRNIVLYNSIEIGRRLVEAKAMVDHGQWGEWLEQSVDYSQRTATNLMKIAEEYGHSSNWQALADLNYTQAVALLGIPSEEREEFVQTNPVDEMSTRELQQAIKEKRELEQKLKDTEKKAAEEHQAYQKVSDSYERLEKTNHEHYETAERLKRELEVAKASGNVKEVERLQTSLKNTDTELELSKQKIKELERELKAKPVEVTTATVEIEKVPEEVKRELNELRKKTKELEVKADQQNNAAIAKFTVYFDTVVKDFGSLLGALAEVKESDLVAHEKYKTAVVGLFGKMSERL